MELAEKLYISRVTLGKYERDEQVLSFEIFLKLLDLFQISADAFLEKNKTYIFLEKEIKFLEELRKDEYLYKRVMAYPKIEIQKLKNLY